MAIVILWLSYRCWDSGWVCFFWGTIFCQVWLFRWRWVRWFRCRWRRAVGLMSCCWVWLVFSLVYRAGGCSWVRERACLWFCCFPEPWGFSSVRKGVFFRGWRWCRWWLISNDTGWIVFFVWERVERRFWCCRWIFGKDWPRLVCPLGFLPILFLWVCGGVRMFFWRWSCTVLLFLRWLVFLWSLWRVSCGSDRLVGVLAA